MISAPDLLISCTEITVGVMSRTGKVKRNVTTPPEKGRAVSEETRQDICRKLASGTPPGQLITEYGKEMRATIYRYKKEIETRQLVNVGGRFTRSTTSPQPVTSPAADVVAKSASTAIIAEVNKATRDEAVTAMADKLSIGHFAVSRFAPLAAQEGMTPEHFLEVAVGFWQLYHEYVHVYYDKCMANSIYISYCEKLLEQLEREKEGWQATNEFLIRQVKQN